MTITSYFGLKPCCDCGRTGNYTVNKNGYQFTVCTDCVHNYSEEEEKQNYGISERTLFHSTKC